MDGIILLTKSLRNVSINIEVINASKYKTRLDTFSKPSLVFGPGSLRNKLNSNHHSVLSFVTSFPLRFISIDLLLRLWISPVSFLLARSSFIFRNHHPPTVTMTMAIIKFIRDCVEVSEIGGRQTEIPGHEGAEGEDESVVEASIVVFLRQNKDLTRRVFWL